MVEILFYQFVVVFIFLQDGDINYIHTTDNGTGELALYTQLEDEEEAVYWCLFPL